MRHGTTLSHAVVIVSITACSHLPSDPLQSRIDDSPTLAAQPSQSVRRFYEEAFLRAQFSSNMQIAEFQRIMRGRAIEDGNSELINYFDTKLADAETRVGRFLTTVSAEKGRDVARSLLLSVQQTIWPTNGWTSATPESAGLQSSPWIALDSAFRAGRNGNVNHLLVIRRGLKVFESNYRRDYRQIAAGRRSPIGCGPGACDGFKAAPGFNYFDPEQHPYYRNDGVLHNLQSTSKSIVATVLGVALQRGAIRSLDTSLLSYLQNYASVIPDRRLARATLKDLLTMRTGIEWHEQDRPLDSTNTTVQLEASADWVRFTLSQPMDADPGTKWAYNSGGSHLISAVIRSATGQDAASYAREHLFAPLGIKSFHWKLAGGGLPDGESGVYLSAESLAKIGLLYLRDGVWDGRRILPEGWARTATSKLVTEGVAGGYGYQWWRADRGALEVWATRGFGGNYMLVIPAEEMIVVSLGWNVFGDRVPDTMRPLIDAIVASTAR